jgi:cytochrome b pre-mRNA-processing protein 3
MFKDKNLNIIAIESIYNTILSICRNKVFYTKFDLIDTFQNRIHLIFLHISFIFMKIKHDKTAKLSKIFYQSLFDLIFKKIEVNMREIGYGDTTINKNMKHLVKIFYDILLNCEKYRNMNEDDKFHFFNKYLQVNSTKKKLTYKDISVYFNDYESFCFDLSPDSVLQGKLNFKLK